MASRKYVPGRRLYWMEIGTLFAMRLSLCLRFRLVQTSTPTARN